MRFHFQVPRNGKPSAPFLGMLFAAWAAMGMSCQDHPAPPSLPAARFTDIHLVMLHPETATPGVSLVWSYPSAGRVTYFEIFQSYRSDSLGLPVATVPAEDSDRAALPLPDTASPFALYFAARAVFVEPTGQKLYGDTLPVDSLIVSPPVAIRTPARGSLMTDRILVVEAEVVSNFGVTLRQSLFEKTGLAWEAKLDTCLPHDDCATPVIGTAVRKDTFNLEPLPVGTSLPALLCVQGTESFEGHSTGLTQSMTCSGFTRTGL